ALTQDNESAPNTAEFVEAKPTTRITGPRSFRGPTLTRHREALGISLESISSETKMKASHFEAIEAEDIEALPGPFFLRGFLKAYASCLGLDPDEVVKGFLESIS
ncbi:MAG: helix-turn-helix transcriptional regulator, partial [bacterium]|nr:helix-turn-helix transcriptional regulator [bacterium]